MRLLCFKTKGTGSRRPGLQNPIPLVRVSTPLLQGATSRPQTPALLARISTPHLLSAIRTPWDQAIDRLKPEDRQLIDLNDKSLTKLDILRAIADETEEQKQVCKDKQWRYKNRKGEEVLIRDSVNSLLLNIKQYTAIVDPVVQPLPSVVSLAWGGFKILLQVAITDMENTVIAFESLDALSRILGHCAIYERLYGQPGQGLVASQLLNESLVDLYALVLEYLCYLKRHLGHGAAAQGFKNITSGLKTRWEALLVVETAVDKEASIAQHEASAKQLYVCDESMQKMVALLRETNALQMPILEIKNTVEQTQSTVKTSKRIVEDIFKTIKDDRRLAILNWISNISPTKHHEFIKSARSAGTGGWLLEKASFRKWANTDSSSLLWLHGIAGSGKTMLTSNIIDELEPETENNELSLAYFYCNYKEDERRDPASILRSLIKQLCLMSPSANENSTIPEPVLSMYCKREAKADLRNTLTVEECKTILVGLSAGFLRTTIVIDALDECHADTRGALFEALEHVVSSSANPVKVFVTSRDYADLRRQFEKNPNVYIQERDNSSDIKKYIKTEIQARIKSGELLSGQVDMALEKHIVGALEAGARGMFIWVKYQIAKICHEVTKQGVEKALAELPHDLDEMYSEVLQSIRTRSKRSPRTMTMAENALRWILCALRPLTPAELIAGISITPGESTDDLASEGLTVQVILDICQPLLVLDSGLEVLRFAHFSVQEFLLGQYTREKSHTHVAEACLTLLVNHDPRPASDDQPQAYAMLDYATFNWAAHVRLSGAGSNTLTHLWGVFLTPSPAYQTWISNVSRAVYELTPQSPGTLAPLLVACYYQLVDICANLLLAETHPNAINFSGKTSLHFAARHGCVDSVRLLLEKVVEVNTKDKYGHTPLLQAVRYGHEKIVEMLLEKGADVGTGDKEGSTPLSQAASHGHEKMVEMLLEKGAEVSTRDRYGNSPLCEAARCGHEKIVEMLLEKGADVGTNYEDDNPPLLQAARYGHEKMVEMLLEKGAEVNTKDRYGNSPLLQAAMDGHEKMVEMLLEKGAEVNTNDKDGNSPLLQAARDGHEQMVEMLLEKGAEVNTKNLFGKSPLFDAAEGDHEKIVEMLLEKGAEVNTKDLFGKSPLFEDAQHDHEKMVEMLLEKWVKVNTIHKDVHTPLLQAVRYGHEKMVEKVLEIGAEVNTNDKDGDTPLSRAPQHDHEKIVKMLLEKWVEVNTKDRCGLPGREE